jgi:hypothetical protein
MSYLEFLRNGSDFHKVSPGTGGFSISATDPNSDEGRQRFHKIVEEAREHASAEGYEVTNLHKSSRDSNDWWDIAVIIVR